MKFRYKTLLVLSAKLVFQERILSQNLLFRNSVESPKILFDVQAMVKVSW
jgi:hypothetical protein